MIKFFVCDSVPGAWGYREVCDIYELVRKTWFRFGIPRGYLSSDGLCWETASSAIELLRTVEILELSTRDMRLRSTNC